MGMEGTDSGIAVSVVETAGQSECGMCEVGVVGSGVSGVSGLPTRLLLLAVEASSPSVIALSCCYVACPATARALTCPHSDAAADQLLATTTCTPIERQQRYSSSHVRKACT